MVQVQYKVTGAAAHATVNSRHGRVNQLHVKGTLLPPDVPQSEIDHLLSVRLIGPVVGMPARPDAETGTEGVGEGTVGEPDAGTRAAASQPDPELEGQRVEAQAKLQAANGKPNARHGQPVWVEYVVTLGYSYEAAAKESKEELQRLAEGVGTR